MDPLFRSALAKIIRHLRDVPRALRLVWDAAPRWTLWSAVIIAAQGLLPVASVCLSRSLVNSTITALRHGTNSPSVRNAVIAATLLGAVALAGEILRSLGNWVRSNQGELVQDHIVGLVHRKSVEVDLAFYDSPEFFDRLHRARSEAYFRPLALLDSVTSLLRNAITLSTMFVVLLGFGLWIPLALAVATVPAFFVVLRYAILQHELRMRTTEEERRAGYHDWLLTSRETAAELRLFGLGHYFADAFDLIRRNLRREKTGLARGNALAELGAGTAALAVTGASLGFTFWRALHGLLSLGDLTLFYQAFQQALAIVKSVLNDVGQLYYNSLFVGNLFEFLALSPGITAPAAPLSTPRRLRTGVELKNVTFTYAGARQPLLRNFSLRIPAGRMVALVGPNGSGKSTLAKLLCRFYDPDSGRIEFDGMDLRSFSPDELRSRVSVVFQDPVRYNATAAESIALGQRGEDPTEARIRFAAQRAGAEEVIESLPLAYQTPLGRMFLDGEELSGGQWQRLALARAFYRDAGVLILDEPTSAMDPWAEADWLDRLRDHARGRTTVIITHRLTTAMRADLICVMIDGDIAESGSHEQLLKHGGTYAKSWERQTQSSVPARA